MGKVNECPLKRAPPCIAPLKNHEKFNECPGHSLGEIRYSSVEFCGNFVSHCSYPAYSVWKFPKSGLQLEVVDRSLQHGDIVRWADPSKGGMKGTITKIDIKVNIRVLGARHLQVKNISCNQLAPLQVSQCIYHKKNWF